MGTVVFGQAAEPIPAHVPQLPQPCMAMAHPRTPGVVRFNRHTIPREGLPTKHRAAVRWSCVYRNTPAIATRELGFTYDGFYKHIRDSRQMVMNLVDRPSQVNGISEHRQSEHFPFSCLSAISLCRSGSSGTGYGNGSRLQTSLGPFRPQHAPVWIHRLQSSRQDAHRRNMTDSA